jgi:uncharacterized protein
MTVDPDTTSLALPSTPPRKRILRNIFIGPDGMRAGWRLAIFVALANAIGLLIDGSLRHLPSAASFFSRMKHSGSVDTPEALLYDQGLHVFVFLITAAIMARGEKRPFGAYGLPLRQTFGTLFAQGVIWGLIYQTAEMILIWILRGFSFGSMALSGTTLVKYALVWAVGYLLVGINEEFQFRGYAQFTLTDGIGFWPAAIVTSALFGAVHISNANENWIGVLNVVLFGLFACFTLRRTGNLWWIVGFHAATDYGESFIYSIPDSGQSLQGHLLSSTLRGPNWLTGGAVGPEASLIDFLLLGLTALAFAKLYHLKNENVR